MILQYNMWGAGELAQGLKALVVLAEGPDSISSTYMEVQSHLQLQFQGTGPSSNL